MGLQLLQRRTQAMQIGLVNFWKLESGISAFAVSGSDMRRGVVSGTTA